LEFCGGLRPAVFVCSVNDDLGALLGDRNYFFGIDQDFRKKVRLTGMVVTPQSAGLKKT